MLDFSTINKLTAAQSKLQLSNERFKAYEKKQQRTEQKASEKQGILDQLREQQEEAQRKQKVDDLDARLKNGQELTQEEVAYLQKERPGLYEERMKERQEQESYRKALENADTKDDVDKLHMARLSQYMTETNTVMNDPAIGKSKKLEIIENIEARFELTEKATLRFKKSADYADLPDDENEKIEAERADDAQQADGQQEAKAADTDSAASEKTDGSGKTDAARTQTGEHADSAPAAKEAQPSEAAQKPRKGKTVKSEKDAEALTKQLLALLHSAKAPQLPTKKDRLDILA